ncbi:protein RADIALIS-like 1 [Beta vulgaris subsp. vulgaris]|uniref:protein RADIALIS-like 1 n=1 Tax=Beta vulgaris subsp. vulgaris TaxID=3555 RepID=UPI002036FFDE|nr:protein RADIALIS-like 1 [Beta vulgaris subsp. vulgaris]
MEWTFAENKTFENTLAELGLENPNLVQEIALRLPGKTIEQIQTHYDALVKDVEMIELGHFDETLEKYGGCTTSHIVSHDDPHVSLNSYNPQAQPHRVPRRSPTPWTDEEHE